MSFVAGSLAPEQRERNFFAAMAAVIALSIIVGFGSWSLRGLVVHPIPRLVHVHALVFLTWIGLFIAQTLLIRRNRRPWHRKLGWFAVTWAVVMLVVGTSTALESVTLNRVPSFFTPEIFLALSFLELAAFITLLGAAIATRKRSDWHRRLMLGATVAIAGPAWGRILPMAALGPMGGLAIMGVILLYVVVAIGFDLYLRKRIHPSYYWVLLVIIVENLGVPILAGTPVIGALAKALAPH